MPLYAGELNIRRGAPLAEYPAPLSDVLTAQRQQTRIESPTNALGRLNELDRAMSGDVIDIGDPMEGRPSEYAPVRRLDAETARARVKEEGLPLTIPDDGIPERALDILIKRKREEMQRQNVMARGPDGVGAGAARLGVALFESLLDPLNIASAFVPVVGPARYAAMVGRAGSAAGRAAVRARVGAIEGAAGAAIVEPLIYSAMQAEQADYDMADSLANIAFGSIFGGGLHVGGGALRDVVQPGWWRLADRPATPAPADPVALRALDAAPTTWPAVRARGAVDALELAQRVADAESRPGFERTADDLLALKQDRTPEVARAAEILSQPAFERKSEDVLFLKALEKGHEADYINERIGQNLREMEAIDRRVLSRGNSPTSEGAMLAKRDLTQALERDAARLAEIGRSPNEARLVMERVSPETRQATLRAAVSQAAQGRRVDVDALVQADRAARGAQPTVAQTTAAVRAAAQRQTSADSVMSAEPPRTAQSEVVKRDLDAAQEELDNTVSVTDELATAIGLERGTVKTALADYDEAIKRAEAYAKALKAGAACGIA